MTKAMIGTVKIGDVVYRKRINRETDPLADGTVVDVNGRFAVVRFPYQTLDGLAHHNIRIQIFALIPWSKEEQTRRADLVAAKLASNDSWRYRAWIR